MTDVSGGPGWWQASDDKWYPPETHPDYRPPPPVAQAPVVGGPKDFTRICRMCGHRRLLPGEFAFEKVPSEFRLGRSRRGARFGFAAKQRVVAGMHSTALISQQERVLQNAMCPRCGSSEFDQFHPGMAPAP